MKVLEKLKPESMTWYELAQRAEVKPSTVYRWRDRGIDLDTFPVNSCRKLAKALGITEMDLIKEIEKED